MNPELTTWVVNLVLATVIGLVGFFARNAFGNVETALKAMSEKLDGISSSVARGEGDRRVTDTRLEALALRVEKLERHVEELSEGVAR